jgi:hypothetical protein
VGTVTSSVPRVKSSIVSCEPFAISGDAVGILVTTLAGKRGCCALYKCTRIDCDDLAYQLDKLHCQGSDPEAESYCVNLSMSTCECKGFLRHGTPCKHITSCRTLYVKGVLP